MVYDLVFEVLLSDFVVYLLLKFLEISLFASDPHHIVFFQLILLYLHHVGQLVIVDSLVDFLFSLFDFLHQFGCFQVVVFAQYFCILVHHLSFDSLLVLLAQLVPLSGSVESI